jgi:ribonuclease HI
MLPVAVNRLETYCDASVPRGGKAVGGWVTYEEGGSITRFQGNGYLGVAETREAECMAVAEGMGTDLVLLEVGVGNVEEVVVYTDNICVWKALDGGAVLYQPLEPAVEEVRLRQSMIESYGVPVHYEWTRRTTPRMKVAHLLARTLLH